jgi:hypothetical protein
MHAQETIFRRKNDFYYITLLAYVVFAIAYIGLTGTVSEGTLQFGFRDPVVYIIVAFLLINIVALIVNTTRNMRLVLTPTSIMFRTRFHERVIAHADITSVVVKRERARFNDGTFAVVKLRVPGRLRWVRIRMANYEREKELYEAFKALKQALKK